MGMANPHGDGKRPPQVAPEPVPFGDYALLSRVAIGGMAEVFLAQSRRADLHDPTVPIALKRILPHMAEDPEFRRMFIDEAQIAARLDHPNIVPIRRLGTVGDALFIAMEFVWGKDLLQIINRFRRLGRRIPAGMAAYVAYNMCGALAYAHDKLDPQGRPLSLVHRDVSPQNVLVGYDGSVRLIDFGIARAASRQTKTQTGVLKGKFGYMSPEQVRGLPIDHRSDLFAVGTCIWEMLTSDRLFAAESDFATLEKVRNAEVEPPSAKGGAVPADLEAIVMKALACDREERFQTARELRMALQSFLTSEPVPFDVSRLSTWMHHLFGPEIEQEKGLTSVFQRARTPRRSDPGFDGSIPTPVAQVAVRPTPTGPKRVFQRPTEAAAFRDGGAASTGFDELAEEPTQIYRGQDLEDLAGDDPAGAGAGGAGGRTPADVGAAAIRWDAPSPVPPPLPVAPADGFPSPSQRLPGASSSGSPAGWPPGPPPGAGVPGAALPRLDPQSGLSGEDGDDGLGDGVVAGLRRGVRLPRPLAWLGNAERRWMVGAAVAAAIVLAAMLSAILGS